MDEPLGFRLRRLREARRMSLDKLAVASGVSKSMLSKIETGARDSLTLDRAAEICNALDISLDQLAGRHAPNANRKRSAAIVKARKLAEALQRTLAEID
jgi:transcriptional regulator with XRE-family HTH domain